VITPVELHELEIYRRVYGPLRVEHQMAFTLPATPGRILGVALSRSEYDYSDEERALVERARPFLIQSWRNALELTTLREELARRPLGEALANGEVVVALRRRGLTDRQAEILELIARGRSSRDAAAVLSISERTVQKYPEHCYSATRRSRGAATGIGLRGLYVGWHPLAAARRLTIGLRSWCRSDLETMESRKAR